MSWRLVVVALLVGCARAGDRGDLSGGNGVTARGVHFEFDGNPAEWRVAQPMFTDSSSRTTSIWVDEGDAGLVVAGVVTGVAPKWPARESELSKSDRVIISLADRQPAEFPPIGWGHQFGFEKLASSADCARSAVTEENRGPRDRGRCVAWYENQLRYRDTVSRLFERVWQLAPGLAQEISAARAFDSLEAGVRDVLAPLRPGLLPQLKVDTAGARGGYGFEAVVPWEAFPPVRSLDLRDLRLSVRVAGASEIPGAPTWSNYTLPRPRLYAITPCRYGIEDSIAIFTGPGRDWINPSDHARAYYIPAAILDIRRTLVLDNEASGYLYQPDQGTRSPIVRVAQYWTRDLGDGDLLCGPRLAMVRGERTTRSEWVIDQGERVEVKALPGGDRLIKDGPRVWSSYYGSGQCGACPRVGLTIYHLDEGSGAITRAFENVAVAESESNDIDYAVSPDWQTVEVYQGTTGEKPDSTGALTWKQTSFCFKPSRKEFEECGTKQNVPPPSPRNINPDSLYH